MSKYGYYSPTAVEQGYGTYWWKTETGLEVEVTMVLEDEPGTVYGWEDKMYVGRVEEYSRPGTPNSRDGQALRDHYRPFPFPSIPQRLKMGV